MKNNRILKKTGGHIWEFGGTEQLIHTYAWFFI